MVSEGVIVPKALRMPHRASETIGTLSRVGGIVILRGFEADQTT